MSRMLHGAQRIGLDGGPVDAVLGLLIHEPAHGHVVAADQVQAVLHLLAGLVAVGRRKDALDRGRQYQVRRLVVA